MPVYYYTWLHISVLKVIFMATNIYVSSRPIWSTKKVPGQLGLHTVILCVSLSIFTGLFCFVVVGGSLLVEVEVLAWTGYELGAKDKTLSPWLGPLLSA